MKIALLLALVTSQILVGQNLVLNGSFEDYYSCPSAPNINYKTSELAPGWNSPTSGTPDVYNRCNKGTGNVPHNWAGVARAHSGDGYAGIYVYANGYNYREYLQTKLKTSLQKDKKYRIEFYFRLASYSRYTIDRVGAVFSDTAIHWSKDKVIDREPMVSKVYDSAFRRTSGLWEKVSQEYVARGGESYLVIGNFFDDAQSNKFHLEFEPIQEPMLANACYYYIDDVSVVDLDSVQPHPEVLVADKKIKLNEVYVLKNIQFLYNRSALQSSSFPELEKLVVLLKENDDWKVMLIGHTDDVGSLEFNQQLSEARAKSVANFLIARGIAKQRIVTKGMGKQQPLVLESNEAARATNRRVECTFSTAANEGN